MVVELPLQIVAVPLTTEVGRGFTVIVALPVLSPFCEVHLESDKAVTVYVVVEEGVTLRVAGLAETPVCVVPSDQVTFHGPVPVRSAWMLAEVPLHTVVLSALLTTEVGRGFTVITALPVRSPARAVHLLSVRAVTV